MNEYKPDQTAAIFAELGITPDVWPELFANTSLDGFPPYKQIPVCDLLDGSLEADGLAVRLVRMIHGFVLTNTIFETFDWERDMNVITAEIPLRKDVPFAHAVHDALVEVLGIGMEEQ